MRSDARKCLIGTVNLLGRVPCFVFPIFEDNGKLYIQIIDDQNKIINFTNVSAKENTIVKTDQEGVTRHIGDEGLFAFCFSTSEIKVGIKNYIAQEVRNRYDSFSTRPFLRYVIANFLKDESLMAQAKTDASALIQARSPAMQLKAGPGIFEIESKDPLDKLKLIFQKAVDTITDNQILANLLFDIIAECQKKALNPDSIFEILHKNRGETEAELLIKIAVDLRVFKGLDDPDVLDLKLHNSFAQFGLLTSKLGSIITTDKLAYAAIREQWKSKKYRTKDTGKAPDNRLKKQIVDIQEYLSPAGVGG